jgi:short-subunit dehydrogenase
VETATESQKTVLITGASSGFGLTTARLLSENGYRVFGTSRDPTKLKEVPAKVEMLRLDINSDESVGACVNSLLEKTGGKVDVLVNNAGFVLYGAVEEASMEEAKAQLETNLFGAVRMIKAVLPTMRKQKSGCIINIGSLAGYVALPFQGYYATSKFALEGLTESLRHEVRSMGIKVSIVEPGFFKTNIAGATRDTKTNIADYEGAKKRVDSAMSEREGGAQDPILVAKTVIKIIQTEKPKLHYPVGREKSSLLFKRIIPQSMFENQVRRMFRLDK